MSGDVEGCTVGRGGDRDRQPALHGHSPLEAHQLHRNLALIVIHGHNGIADVFLCAHEDRVRRERAIYLDTLRLGLLDGWRNGLDLFIAE